MTTVVHAAPSLPLPVPPPLPATPTTVPTAPAVPSTAVVVPPAAPGAGGLVPCGGESGDPCGFADLIILTSNIINFLIVFVLAPIAAIMFLYAGYEMMTARGNVSQITSAKKMFMDILMGALIAFAAWLIVEGIMAALSLKPEFWLLG